MRPIITLYHPLPEIALVEIFSPRLRDESTVSFFIKMDIFSFVLELKEDGSWRSKGFNVNCNSKVLGLIQERIGQLYANHLNHSTRHAFNLGPMGNNLGQVI